MRDIPLTEGAHVPPPALGSPVRTGVWLGVGMFIVLPVAILLPAALFGVGTNALLLLGANPSVVITGVALLAVATVGLLVILYT